MGHFQTGWTVEPKRKNHPLFVLIKHRMKEIETKIEEKLTTTVKKIALQSHVHRATAYHELKRIKDHAHRAALMEQLKAPDPAHRLITK